MVNQVINYCTMINKFKKKLFILIYNLFINQFLLKFFTTLIKIYYENQN